MPKKSAAVNSSGDISNKSTRSKSRIPANSSKGEGWTRIPSELEINRNVAIPEADNPLSTKKKSAGAKRKASEGMKKILLELERLIESISVDF